MNRRDFLSIATRSAALALAPGLAPAASIRTLRLAEARQSLVGEHQASGMMAVVRVG